MPQRKMRLSRTEEKESKATLAKLEKLGVEVKYEETREPEAIRFHLHQIDREFARVYDLPVGCAVTLPCKLVVLKSGVMFTDADVHAEWDDWLDLEEPREHRSFEEFAKDFPTWPPKILNDLLVNHPRPLRTCQMEGLVIATGWSRVPADYADEKQVRFVLCLRDEQREEFYFDFVARVDRRLKRMYERRRPDPLTLHELRAKRTPLVSQEKSEHDVGRDAKVSARRNAKEDSKPIKYRDTIQ